MSTATVRRKDKIMADVEMRQMLEGTAVGRTATVGADSQPYVVPNLFVYSHDLASNNTTIWLHTANANGHFQQNATDAAAVCFEIDEAGAIYPTDEFECNTTISYRSVVCYGTIRVVEDRAEKAAFFDAFMDKYGSHIPGRPLSYYPRLDATTVYAIRVTAMTGKKGPLPDISAQWPANSLNKPPSTQQPPDGTPLRASIEVIQPA